MTLDNIDRDTHELLGERPKAGHASPSAVLSTFSRRERDAEGGRVWISESDRGHDQVHVG